MPSHFSLSADTGSNASLGGEEFEVGQDSASFLARLAEDEAAVQEANKLMLVSSAAAVLPVHPHQCMNRHMHWRKKTE